MGEDKNIFFKNGLKFKCIKNCAKCCSISGLVYVYDEDIERISKQLRIETKEFKRTYCEKLNNSFILKDKPGTTTCIFLNSARCSIYNARPSQCRAYPFWFNILISEQRWNLENIFCPGIGKGELFSKKEILKLLGEHPQFKKKSD